MEVFWRAGIEEEMMIEQFGDQYRAFMQETGRFTPRLIH
jgi:protein-S-isoprenylcysteine O-methyltransferase Ste14